MPRGVGYDKQIKQMEILLKNIAKKHGVPGLMRFGGDSVFRTVAEGGAFTDAQKAYTMAWLINKLKETGKYAKPGLKTLVSALKKYSALYAKSTKGF